ITVEPHPTAVLVSVDVTLSLGTVSRNCTSDGWSEPTPPYHIACSVEDDIPEVRGLEWYFSTVRTVYTIGYASSLVSLSIAVGILLHFRRLRCARNYIHIQLFLTFILRAAAVFVKDRALFNSTDTEHCSLSTVTCKASVVLCHYCVMANFFWLLVEALYLNSLLMWARHGGNRLLWWFALLGWGVPAIFMLMWIMSRVYFEDTERLTKSTLLLIPLFGTHYMVFNFLPDSEHVGMRLCIELCLGSFQGLIVAILYCFLNKEVQTEIHMRWLRWHENSYGAVPAGIKCSQMDTPF
ncbi:growth hormone-releasing hormone receptor-like, partial [Scleropages formosus]